MSTERHTYRTKKVNKRIKVILGVMYLKHNIYAIYMLSIVNIEKSTTMQLFMK